ncbi:MAG: hypothetical protein LBL66_03465 [Clostridiales bacterium]|nr:hypothetical protein [Clostridiales bacterium]
MSLDLLRGGRIKRPTRQSLYKKARFVFCRDCRAARSALLAMTRGAFAPLAIDLLRGAFPCPVEIAASRFALLAMTNGAFRAPRNDP